MTPLKSSVAESSSPELLITGIEHPTILEYFQTLNAGEFTTTSQLFAEDGALNPPFESAIIGPDAIAEYLVAEAKGMILQPREGTLEPLEEGGSEAKIKGRVQTPWFGVNVGWVMTLNSEDQITSVTVKLLASPQELLNLRREK